MKTVKNSLNKNVKRCFFAAAVIFAALLLVGCTKAEIECGVTEEAEAYVNIRVEAECAGVSGIASYDVYDAMNLIRYHYVKELGYEGSCVRVPEENDKVVLTLRKSEQADSVAEAVDKLKNMIEDGQTSVFSAATLEISGDESAQGYSLALTLCAEDILSEEQLEQLPAHGREIVEPEISEIDAVLSVVLPSTEVIESTGQTVQEGAYAMAEIPISLNDPTKISLKTKVSFDENGIPMTSETKNEMIMKLYEKRNSEFMIAVILGVTALCAGIIIAVMAVKIKKRVALTLVTEEKSKNGIIPENENT